MKFCEILWNSVVSQKFGQSIELPLALLGMAGMNLMNAFLGIDLSMFSRERTPRLRSIIIVNDRKKTTKTYCILYEVVSTE